MPDGPNGQKRRADIIGLRRYLKRHSIGAVFALLAASPSHGGQTTASSYCSEYEIGRSEARELIKNPSEWLRLGWNLADCIYINARNLSGGPDDAETIARGINTICFEEKTYVIAFDEAESKRNHETLSEPDAIEKGIETYVTSQARATVLQSRAAHCPPLPNPNSNAAWP